MGSGLPVHYWELPLSDAFTKTQCVGVNDFLRFGNRYPWIKLAHFSRPTKVAVFISGPLLTVTNNAEHIELETKNWLRLAGY